MGWGSMLRVMHGQDVDRAGEGQYTLGMLIDRLEAVEDKSRLIRFDFGYLSPQGFISWRGVYSHLAIRYTNYRSQDPDMTVERFLQLAHEADGGTFEGYKGGNYVMSRSTPLWVSESNEANNTIIHDVTDDGYVVMLHTRWQEDSY